MEEKKKKSKGSVGVIILLIIIILGLVGYISYDNFLAKTTDETESAKKEEKKVTKVEKIPTLIKFDSSKCINNNSDIIGYTLAQYDNADGFSAKLSEDKKNVEFTVNWNLYGPLSDASAYAPESKVYKISGFDKEIEDIYIGGFGQDVSGATILYLMSDGTVEYTPIVYSIKNDGDTFKSYGSIDTVEDVVKFLTADVKVQNGSGYVTTLAQKADGTFYDLWPSLQKTSYYQ